MRELNPNAAAKKNPQDKPDQIFEDLDKFNYEDAEKRGFSKSFGAEAIKKLKNAFGEKPVETIGGNKNVPESKKSEVYDLESFGKREPREDEVKLELERIIKNLILIEKQLQVKGRPEAIKREFRKKANEDMQNMPAKEKWGKVFGNEFLSIEELKKRIDLLI